MEFVEAREWYEQMGGDLGKLPSYVGYTDAVEKVLDLGKPEVEEESDEEEEEKKKEEEEEDEDEEEDDDYEEEDEEESEDFSSDDDVSVSMPSSSDDVNLEYNLRGFSDDEEEDEISLSMKELDERPSSVLSNGRSPGKVRI